MFPDVIMAEALLKKAEKEKSRWFVSEETKTQNAADYIEQAGNIYKSQKQHKEAAECFIRAAALKLNIGRAYESAGLFKSAGIQLKIVGDPTATQTLGRAVQIYSELGKGSMAAKLSKELGEGSERAQEYEDAALHFQQAADLFKGEGSDTHARQCLEKVAQFSTMTDSPDYLKAAGLFEEIGVESLSTRLGRFNARKYFFRSVLCTMASGDCIGARAKHSEFMETDYQFGTSREGKFLNQLITALEEMSGDKFSQAYRGKCRMTCSHILPCTLRSFGATSNVQTTWKFRLLIHGTLQFCVKPRKRFWVRALMKANRDRHTPLRRQHLRR